MSTQDGEGQTRVIKVRVTNSNDFVVKDFYNGTPYVFEPKKPITIPMVAASHIFGWRPTTQHEERGQIVTIPASTVAEMEAHTLRRLGWNTPKHMEQGTGKRWFSKFKIEPVTFRLTEVTVEEEEGDQTTAAA